MYHSAATGSPRVVRLLLAAALAALSVATRAGAAPPPADNSDPGSNIFDMSKPGSIIKPAAPPATEPAQPPTPGDVTPPPTPPTPNEPAAAPPAMADPRGPVPPAAERAAAAKRVSETYAAKVAAAGPSPEAMRALAVQMLGAAAVATSPADLFATLELARDTAAGAGDLRLAEYAIALSNGRFEVDAPRLAAAAAAATVRAPLSPADRRFAVLRAATLSDLLVSQDRAELTTALDAALATVAGELRDATLTGQLRAANTAHAADRSAAISALQQRAVLQSRPTDPAANEAVGRYDCLIRGDWDAGLPRLAVGHDPALKAAAAADLAAPMDFTGRVAVADAWRAAGKGATGSSAAPGRARLFARAARWYGLALAVAIDVQQTKVEAKQREVTAAAADPAAAGTPRVVDLLALADPARDSIDSSWSTAGPDLISGRAQPARLALPYRPPHEYDLRVSFTRTQGNDVLSLICPGRCDGTPGVGRPFRFGVGELANTVCAFGRVEGKPLVDNPTTARGRWLKNGRSATVLVQVRADHVSAFLDDQLVATYKTDDCLDLGLDPFIRLPRPDELGLVTWGSAFEIHSADLIEVSGHGAAIGADEGTSESPVVATVSYLEPGNHHKPGSVDLLADGRVHGADGKNGVWYLHGSAITFQWGQTLDKCTLSPNRRSFAGRNPGGDDISGTVTSGAL
jgi:hypothetical protein